MIIKKIIVYAVSNHTHEGNLQLYGCLLQYTYDKRRAMITIVCSRYAVAYFYGPPACEVQYEIWYLRANVDRCIVSFDVFAFLCSIVDI